MGASRELSELQKRIATKSDQSAFKKLFEIVSPNLCKFACQYVSIEEAEEVVYLILTRLWSNRESLQEINNLNAYLYRAVRFEVIKVNKQKNRINLIVIDDETEHTNQEYFCAPVTPESLMAAKELQDFIAKQVDNLPPKCKLAFKLVKEDHLKYAEVAEIMGVSKNTIENHVSKALKLLKQAVLKYENSDKASRSKRNNYFFSFFL